MTDEAQIPEEDDAQIEVLTKQILDVLNASKIDANRENSIPMGTIFALVDALICVLVSVDCPGCRRNAAKGIKQLMRGALEEAMRQSSASQGPHHIH